MNDGVSILKPSSLPAFPDTVLDLDFSSLGSFPGSRKPPESELFRGEGYRNAGPRVHGDRLAG